MLPRGLPVDLIQSPTVEDGFGLFRGMRYRDVLIRPYDFIFVDGRQYVTAAGDMTCDLDLVHVIAQSDMPVRAVIDKRVSTTFVLQRVLPGKMR